MSFSLIIFFAKLFGWAIVAGGVGMLMFFMFGAFNTRTLNSIHERVSASYGLITTGLLVLALSDWLSGKGSKIVSAILKYVAAHQFVIYLTLAIIVFTFAIIESRKSLQNFDDFE